MFWQNFVYFLRILVSLGQRNLTQPNHLKQTRRNQGIERMQKLKKSVVIFDMDGTIFGTEGF